MALVRGNGAQSDVRTGMVGDYVKICFPLLKSDDVRIRFAALVRGIGTHYRCVLAWWDLIGLEIHHGPEQKGTHKG